jgi:hypothetical protein
MLPADWTPHRRDDGELVGWIRPADDVGERWVPIDVLGREAAGALDWLDAEAALEERGIAWLGEVWMLEREDAVPLRVRLVEVNPDRVVVQTDDFGAIDAPVERFVLPWPAPATLRERRPGDPDGREAWAHRVADARGDR